MNYPKNIRVAEVVLRKYDRLGTPKYGNKSLY